MQVRSLKRFSPPPPLPRFPPSLLAPDYPPHPANLHLHPTWESVSTALHQRKSHLSFPRLLSLPPSLCFFYFYFLTAGSCRILHNRQHNALLVGISSARRQCVCCIPKCSCVILGVGNKRCRLSVRVLLGVVIEIE